VSDTIEAPPFGLADRPVTMYRPRYGHGRRCGFAAVDIEKYLSELKQQFFFSFSYFVTTMKNVFQ
jgi:hypothetical protein